MDDKVKALISYIFFPIGWIISFVTNKEPKSELVSYHLRQALGFGLLSLVFSVIVMIISGILVSISPSLGFIGSLLYLVPLYMWIMGLINAWNEKMEPLPFLGEKFNDWFKNVG